MPQVGDSVILARMSNQQMTVEIDGREVACEVVSIWHSGAKVRRLDTGETVDVTFRGSTNAELREAAAASMTERERGS